MAAEAPDDAAGDDARRRRRRRAERGKLGPRLLLLLLLGRGALVPGWGLRRRGRERVPEPAAAAGEGLRHRGGRPTAPRAAAGSGRSSSLQPRTPPRVSRRFDPRRLRSSHLLSLDLSQRGTAAPRAAAPDAPHDGVTGRVRPNPGLLLATSRLRSRLLFGLNPGEGLDAPSPPGGSADAPPHAGLAGGDAGTVSCGVPCGWWCACVVVCV